MLLTSLISFNGLDVNLLYDSRVYALPSSGETENPYISKKPLLKPLGADPEAWEVTWNNFIRYSLSLFTSVPVKFQCKNKENIELEARKHLETVLSVV